MIAPADTIYAEHTRAFLATIAASAISGGGIVRVLTYISKQMPPLPPDSGWWTKFLYGLVKGTSGLDPSATITPAGPSK